MYYYNMEMKLTFLMINYLRLTENVIKSSMILNNFNDKCKSSPYKKFSSIAIQCEQHNVTNDCVSRGVQYEQDYFSRETQCNITTKTRGVQCSLDNTPDLFESCNSQSNSFQCVSTSTQWSHEDSKSSPYKKFSSIAIQCEQHNVTNDCVSRGVQYEQDYFSCETQCNITTKTRGVQCSLDNTPDLFESCNSQSNSFQCVSTSTQWSHEDTSISTSSQLCDEHTKANNSTISSEYITSTSSQIEPNVFLKEYAVSTSRLQITGKDLNIKQSQRLKFRKKNLSASTLFGSVIRHRKNTYASSTTSGITEMFSSRSDLESVGDSAVSVEQCQSVLDCASPVQVVKPKKKHLWSAQDSVVSISGSECSLDFSSLYSETQKTFTKSKWRRRKTSVKSRCKYTYDEELTIIKYISEKNIYKNVRGVAMWQNMETEIEINRTWQSLKEHFRKKILPNIGEFDLPKKVEESFHKINMK